jgi:hypothetical protein
MKSSKVSSRAIKTRQKNDAMKKSRGELTSSEKCSISLKSKTFQKYPELLQTVELKDDSGSCVFKGKLTDLRSILGSPSRDLTPAELLKRLKIGTWGNGIRKDWTLIKSTK